ncbi:MAG: MBL fold metallo-hydrolase [Pseudomonadales bacterium]|nr:MBL fold metallo-hydrolase [Pseudomonadales bacterium]
MSNLSWSIGDAKITRIVEIEAEMPIAGFFPAATPEKLEPHAEWLKPHFLDDDNNIVLSIHALLIESCGKRIIVDTCVGEMGLKGFDILTPEKFDFPDKLAAAGFPRESIDYVLCTHLHFDHVGWNTMSVGDKREPTFPNARYLFAKVEWEHWKAEKPSPFTATLDDTVRCIVDAGLADLVEMDHRLTDDVRLEGTPGHTPGHVSVHIESQGQRAMITGDMAHHPVQWSEPDWGISADVEPTRAAATRRRLIEEHADQPLLVIGTHYVTPTAGHLQIKDGCCRFIV